MSESAPTKLFQPVRVGDLQLSHRIVLAPLTRFRADDAHVPTPIMVGHYAQRASTPGTLLITEGTFVSANGGGYNNLPGIWSDAQVEGWKELSDRVHVYGGTFDSYLDIFVPSSAPQQIPSLSIQSAFSSYKPCKGKEVRTYGGLVRTSAYSKEDYELMPYSSRV